MKQNHLDQKDTLAIKSDRIKVSFKRLPDNAGIKKMVKYWVIAEGVEV